MIYYFSQYYNEERLIPYIFRHYDSFVDRYFIYNNRSTDKTKNLLMRNPKVTVIDTDAIRDECLFRDFKNSVYKKHGECDWAIVVDADEFVYHSDIKILLESFKQQNITVVKTQGYQMFSESFIKSDKQIYEAMNQGCESKLYSKCCIFRPGIDINYMEGAHACNPSGYVKYSEPEIKLLHYKVLGLSFINEMMKRNEKQSENDKRLGLSIYSLEPGHPFNPKEIYEDLKINAKPVI